MTTIYSKVNWSCLNSTTRVLSFLQKFLRTKFVMLHTLASDFVRKPYITYTDVRLDVKYNADITHAPMTQ